MSLPGHVFAAPDGVIGFDTAETVSPSAAADFRNSGYRFCVRYVRRDKPHASALTATEARSLLNVGIGLMLVQYVESDTSWIPSGTKGTTNGRVAASEATRIVRRLSRWTHADAALPGAAIHALLGCIQSQLRSISCRPRIADEAVAAARERCDQLGHRFPGRHCPSRRARWPSHTARVCRMA